MSRLPKNWSILSIRLLCATFLLVVTIFSLMNFNQCENCSEKNKDSIENVMRRTLLGNMNDIDQESANGINEGHTLQSQPSLAQEPIRTGPDGDLQITKITDTKQETMVIVQQRMKSQREKMEKLRLMYNEKFGGRAPFKEMTRNMYKDKIQGMKDACKRNNIRDSRPMTSTKWLYSRDYNFLFCLNPKSGSSTMKRYLTYLLHMNWTVHLPELKRFKVYDTRTGEQLKYLSKQGLDSGLFVFTIVRHPFSHLVSAYWKFTEYKSVFTGRLNEAFRYHNASTDQPLSPSQMAEFIVNRKPWGQHFGHFKPYAKSCDYCQYDFDAIIDIEDLEDRIQLMADNLKIPEWQKPAVHVNSRPKDPNDAKKFFSNITLSMAKQLYKFYRLDFELFGYDPEPYYKYCQSD